MIKVMQGNIFESGCEALVNPVNCVGVMGAGLALKFKKAFPYNYEPLD
jgi:O-acetyl-ADP-ribose deacetylase (regulator of RNase III)